MYVVTQERERERERIIVIDHGSIDSRSVNFHHGGQIGPDILAILSQFFHATDFKSFFKTTFIDNL